MNKIDEDWIDTGNANHHFASGNSIIAISNRGRIKRKNGNPPEESTYGQRVYIDGECTYIHRFIAEHFLPPPTDKDKKYIDHRTHEPEEGMNINDVENLRWCTMEENNNFEEGRKNKSKALLNKPKSEFGRKYFEHYGYSKSENILQYYREQQYYSRNGRLKGKYKSE